MSKKYKVPVSWQVYGFVTVESENEEGAAHEAMGVDLDMIDEPPEYVSDSYEVDFQAIVEITENE